MNPLLALLRLYTPVWVKKGQLAELFEFTAAALGGEVPPTAGLSFDECLLEYARFTATQAEAAIRRGDDPEALRDRLYRNAFRLGRTLRKTLRITNSDEAMAATRLLYRALRIELRGPVEGEFEVGRCFFSRFYSSRVCQVVSALDAGVVAGLSDGGQLTFYQRITEGQDRCRARLVPRQVTGGLGGVPQTCPPTGGDSLIPGGVSGHQWPISAPRLEEGRR